MSTHSFSESPGRYKVRDLSLAEAGRHQIRLAEHEMPGLMALRAEHGESQPLAGARIAAVVRSVPSGRSSPPCAPPRSWCSAARM